MQTVTESNGFPATLRKGRSGLARVHSDVSQALSGTIVSRPGVGMGWAKVWFLSPAFI
jgi:hypothetical protein